MKQYSSDIFGTVASPTSLNEILKVVSSHAGKRRNVYMWRGQGNIKWPIHSSAYRRMKRTSNKVTEIGMQFYEQRLLKQASHQGYRNENGRVLSDFELLAKLQHHGAATRLIDCSRNILMALWFACYSEPREIGLLIGIHSDYIGGDELALEEDNYKGVLKEIEDLDHPVIWQPPVVTKRIASQSAQFIYSRVVNKKFGSLAVPKKKDVFVAISINPKVKVKLLEELVNTYDIRYLTLFPDIDGFGYANSYRFDEFEDARW